MDGSSSSNPSSSPSDNRRKKSSIARVAAIFLFLVPSLLFNIATLHRSLSAENSSYQESALDYDLNDYPIEEYHRERANRKEQLAAAATYYNRSNDYNNMHPLRQLLLPTAASHPRPATPFRCGVVFFFHIPSTGGASIANWFRKYARTENGNITFFQRWTRAIGRDGLFRPDQNVVQDEFIRGMNAHVSDLRGNEWRSAQLHLVNPPLNTSEHLWYQWRSTIEEQGCQMINAIMLRDPLNHAMSLYKILKSKNGTRADWTNHLHEPSPTGKWATVLDFFLYNIIGPTGRNPYNATKEEKVRRGIELLQRHFDVVSVGDHTQFMNEVLNYTGWKYLDMPHTNVHKKTLEFTKKEVETLYKLLLRNGDIDFVDAVKQRYSGHLSYLLNII